MNVLYTIKNYIFNRVFKLNQKIIKEIELVDEYIEHFNEPKKLFDRSYYQYLCQKKQYEYSKLYCILYDVMNLFSLFMIILLLILPKRLYYFFFPIKEIEKDVDAVAVFGKHLEDRIPEELKKEFNKIHYLESKALLITNLEKKYIFELWREHPFSCNFVLKNLLKVGIYRHSIEEYKNASAIICSCEYSYTSSILTQYCRRRNIVHINIMHGEIYTELSKAFFEFDRFYIWDEYYKKLCVERMRASANQFIVGVPSCLLFDDVSQENIIECKYFFQDHTKDQMVKVKQLLEKITENYMVRPHPLYTNIESLKEVFEESKIESSKISIGRSIMETEKIISWDSTVLLQAYLNGKKTIIDDVSNKSRYKYAVSAGYIMANKSKILSHIIVND